ncbi:MAG: SprT family zinc-dependent metalloprotease [Acidimicrobiaceae bacterium]|nr:SprT family zinc-dependent metalloprotease [Acidimicrobiaceae bacterium]
MNAVVASPSDLLRDLQSLVVGDLMLEVSLSSGRKTIEIVVERDASLTLKAPPTVTVERAQRFVKDKSGWIHRKLIDKDALTGPPVVKQFVEGEGFVYLGRNYRLTLTSGTDNTDANSTSTNVSGNSSGAGSIGVNVSGNSGSDADTNGTVGVRLQAGRFHLPVARVHEGPALMRRWYTEVGGRWLQRRIRPWAARLGEETVEVKVRDLGYRWGSVRPASNGQRINIHWATLQLPPGLIDYVLVHELAHLCEANHTPGFWRIVARLMPDYETHKASLAVIGQTIWLGAVSEV